MVGRRGLAACVLAAGLAAGCGGGDSDAETLTDWRTQLGTDAGDTSFGVSAAPNGDLIVVASTEGALAAPNAGGRDVYIARFSTSGEEVWAIQLGGPDDDSPLGVSLAPDGTIYVAGYTEGDFAGQHQGSADVWLAHFDDDGDELWRTQFGGPAWDRGFDVAAVDDGAYVTGYTSSALDPATDLDGFDGFAAKFDADGNQEWIRQYGSSGTDWGQGAAATETGLYITGHTDGEFGGPALGDKDAFVLRLTSDGELDWVRQFGSPALDWTQGVGIGPDGGVVVAGSTEGSVSADVLGQRDILLAAFSADGTEQFITQIGTPGLDSAFEVRLAGDRIVASATSDGDLTQPHGERDAVLLWFELDGTLAEVQQFGSDSTDEATGLDVADDGTVLYSGYTAGTVGTAAAGGSDVFIGMISVDR